MGRIVNIVDGSSNGDKRKRTVDKNIKIGPISINFITIIIIALVTLFYLAQTQIGTGKKVQIKDLNQKQEDLKKNIELLEVQVADLKSIREIQKRAEALKMLPNTNSGLNSNTD